MLHSKNNLIASLFSIDSTIFVASTRFASLARFYFQFDLLRKESSVGRSGSSGKKSADRFFADLETTMRVATHEAWISPSVKVWLASGSFNDQLCSRERVLPPTRTSFFFDGLRSQRCLFRKRATMRYAKPTASHLEIWWSYGVLSLYSNSYQPPVPDSHVSRLY